MHKNTRDLTGETFNELTAIKKVGNIGGKVAWLFSCSCGKSKEIISTNVVSGKTRSCGCKRSTHGESRSPEYGVWYSMIDRCKNKNHKFWMRYGGRGIDVCDSWLTLEGFLSDMGRRPSKNHQLDRVDNNSGYRKDNCRWVLSVENVRNRIDSKYWFVDGVRYESMRHAAKAVGVAHSTIKNWCNSGKNNCHCERKYDE